MSLSKQILTFLFLLGSIFSNSAHGANFQCLSGDQQVLRPRIFNGFIQIEKCNGSGCIQFPSSQSLTMMQLSGITPSWEKIFKDCQNFQSLNDLYDYTNLAASIATFWNVGPAIRAGQGFKLAINSLGRIGKIVGSKIVVDTAVSAAGTEIAQLPYQAVNDGGHPYPQISETEVVAILDFFDTLLFKSGTYYLPEHVIEAASQVIAVCSSQALNLAKEHFNRECMQNCHGTQQSQYTHSNQPLNTELNTRSLPRVYFKNDLNREELRTYLEDK